MRVVGTLAIAVALSVVLAMFVVPGAQEASAGGGVCNIAFSGGSGSGKVTRETATGFNCVGSTSGALARESQTVFGTASGDVSGTCVIQVKPLNGTSKTTSMGRFTATCTKN